jgi:predicted acylesterase/phospholipase RssA
MGGAPAPTGSPGLMESKSRARRAFEDRPPGKLGLALSGGGFRAAFFHLGVLARMSMLGLLRHVEVISTVSGGSTVGALYYLHVKRLLESKPDSDIADQDFRDLVEQVERSFLAAVERNIRTRAFANLPKNVAMAVLPGYTRSHRVGELYDRYLFQPGWPEAESGPIRMRDLRIHPPGERPDFFPPSGNAHRWAKVPILLIGATSLNTGHLWRFEASTMGEPPRVTPAALEIDKSMRLGQPDSYDAMPPRHRDATLGEAVAASTALPGLFAPFSLAGLYQGIRVQLVDGGVHDNQGIQGLLTLLELGMDRVVASDAAGQIADLDQPAGAILGVLQRSNSVLMQRVREEQLFQLLGAEHRPVAFMHLRKGLQARAVNPIGPGGPPEQRTVGERKPEVTSETGFRVAQAVQRSLSRVRTDLDSFTEVEAFTLMLDGYRMSEPELRASAFDDLIDESLERERWRFLSLGDLALEPTLEYQAQLDNARRRMLKLFTVTRLRAVLSGSALLGLAVLLLYLGRGALAAILSSRVAVAYPLGAMALVLALLALSQSNRAPRLLRTPAELVVNVLRAIALSLAWPVVWFHLLVVDPLFVRQGRAARFTEETDAANEVER